jgi:hypothetical protein
MEEPALSLALVQELLAPVHPAQQVHLVEHEEAHLPLPAALLVLGQPVLHHAHGGVALPDALADLLQDPLPRGAAGGGRRGAEQVRHVHERELGHGVPLRGGGLDGL